MRNGARNVHVSASLCMSHVREPICASSYCFVLFFFRHFCFRNSARDVHGSASRVRES
nr:MAG TPA: hypothetical protein [Caudoviricetes sp.]